MKKIVSIAILAISATMLFATAAAPKKRANATPTASSSSLKNERQQTKREINDTKRKLDDNSRRTRDQLDQLNQINGQIANQRHTISALQTRIDSVSVSIQAVQDSIDMMNGELTLLRDNLKQTLRTMRSRRQAINNMSFIFSAPTFAASMKRLAYLKQLNTWRNGKIKELKEHVTQIEAKRQKLEELRSLHSSTLSQLSVAQNVLTTRQSESERLVNDLKREGSSLQKILSDKQKKLRDLDSQIDRIIAEEQRQAEKQRKEEERRRAEEQRRRQQQQQQQAQNKPEKPSKQKPTKPDAKPDKPAQQAPAKPEKPAPAPAAPSVADESRSLEGSFVSNRGRLLFPVAGQYTIVSYFGRGHHALDANIEIENTGIDIKVPAGTGARAVFDGSVSMVMYMNKYQNVILVRHGHYITVYAGLSSVSVTKGDKVKAGQTLGKIFTDTEDRNSTVLHFEVRHEREKLNPLDWVK